MQNGEISSPVAEFVKVATRDEIPPGAMKAVDVGGVQVLVCNVGGEFHAVHDECTHECFPLSEGTLEGHAVVCMLHGARFDVRSGEILALPAYEPLRTYDVRVSGEDVLVAIG
jgi:3-phenylpropionate/trans-cinnamate dioxygenase ferredoxin subunit